VRVAFPDRGPGIGRTGSPRGGSVSSVGPGARGLHTLRLAPLLREVGRPGGIAQALLLVAAGELEQLVERPGVAVDLSCRVALLPPPGRNRVETPVGRFHDPYPLPPHWAPD